MFLSNLRIRITKYYKKHGLKKAILYFFLKLSRIGCNNKYVIFGVNLRSFFYDTAINPKWFEINCKRSMLELKDDEIKQIYNARDSRMVDLQFKERFSKGAWLWLVKYNKVTAGFVWTLREQPIEPYFMPLRNDDIHLFDNEIFSQFRGQGVNSVLIDNVLLSLKNQGMARAYIETRWWNTQEISSLAKTGFKRIGVARKYRILGKTTILWYDHA